MRRRRELGKEEVEKEELSEEKAEKEERAW